MNANQIKQVVSANKGKFVGHAGPREFDQTTMFVPVATEGKAVINVQRRQEFLNTAIGTWREFHFYRAASAIGAITAVWLLFINPFISAASAVAAAWSYGEFLKKDFTLNNIYKKRHLLEST